MLLFVDKNGFIKSRRFTQDDIYQENEETFNEVASCIAVLSDEWKALQVWARLKQVIVNPHPEEGEVFPESRDAVALTVEAINAGEGAGFSSVRMIRSSRWWTGRQRRCSATSRQIITIMNKITSINGTFIPSLNELKEHTENGTVHVTEDERTAWNAKADASALSTKADTSVFDAHTNDAVAHITEKERETWNGKQDKLTDEEGNMTLTGGLAAPTATINGIFNVHNYSTDPLDTNYIHGRTWCYGQVELRGGAVLRNDLWVEDGVIRINGGGRASLLANGAVHLRGAVDATTCINANGGVNIPLSALTSLSNTTALNTYWAAGLMGLSDIWQHDVLVNRSGNAVYGDGELIDWPAEGQGVAVKVPKGGYCTADIGFSTYLSGSSWGSYNDCSGFYLPLGTLLLTNASTGIYGKVKFTWSTYGENLNRFAYCRDASNMDEFTIAPTGYGGVNASVVDVTIEAVVSGNASVRVRVIYYDKVAAAYRLMTVMASVPDLTGYAEKCRGLVYCQDESQGGVWLVVGSRVCKLAEVPKLDFYEVSGLNILHVDVFGGDLGWTDFSKICFTRARNFNRVVFGGGPCYEVIEAMGTDCQVSTETEPWSSAIS